MKFSLVEIPEIRNMLCEFSKKEPNWKEINNLVKYHKVRTNDKYLLASLVSELHLYSFFKEIHKDENDFIILPVNEKDKTKRYHFRYGVSNLHVKRNYNNSSYCEIDLHAKYNNIPVIFEIKLGRHGNSGKWRRKKGLRYALSDSRKNKIGRFVKERFDTKEFCYAVVCDKWMYGRKTKWLEKFKNGNGLIAPFYSEREPYIQEVKRNTY